jgi:hypothetical protein
LSATAIVDLESKAIDAFLRLSGLIGQALGGATQAKCKPLASRSANLVQLIAQTGLTATTLFYMSKSDVNLYGRLMSALVQSHPRVDQGMRRALREECGSEGRGYTLSLALLAHALDALAGAKLIPSPDGKPNPCSRPTVASFAGLARCLAHLRSQGVELAVERLLAPYLDVTKRMAEAFYKEK